METQSRYSVMSCQREGFRPVPLSDVSVVSLMLVEEATYIKLAVSLYRHDASHLCFSRAESGHESR